MSPYYLGKEGEGQGNVAVMAPSRSVLGMKEHSYLGLSDSSSSSIDGPVMKISIEESKESLNLNLKATELRLGLPGSESHERGKKLNATLSTEPPDKKQLFSLLLSKDGIYSSRNDVSGDKRGFSDTIKEFSSPVKNSSPGERNWMFDNGVSDLETNQSAGQAKTSIKSAATPPNVKTECLSKAEELPEANGSSHNKMNVSDTASAPAAKAQVVGWPPVRSFRKTLWLLLPRTPMKLMEKEAQVHALCRSAWMKLLICERWTLKVTPLIRNFLLLSRKCSAVLLLAATFIIL